MSAPSDIDARVEKLIRGHAEKLLKLEDILDEEGGCEHSDITFGCWRCRQARYTLILRSLAAAVREAAYERGVRDAAGAVKALAGPESIFRCGCLDDCSCMERSMGKDDAFGDALAAILALLSSPEKSEGTQVHPCEGAVYGSRGEWYCSIHGTGDPDEGCPTPPEQEEKRG